MKEKVRVRGALVLEHSVLPFHQYRTFVPLSPLQSHVIITFLSSDSISHRLPGPLKGFGLHQYTLEKCSVREPQLHLCDFSSGVETLAGTLASAGYGSTRACASQPSARQKYICYRRNHSLCTALIIRQTGRPSAAAESVSNLTPANVAHSADL